MGKEKINLLLGKLKKNGYASKKDKNLLIFWNSVAAPVILVRSKIQS